MKGGRDPSGKHRWAVKPQYFDFGGNRPAINECRLTYHSTYREIKIYLSLPNTQTAICSRLQPLLLATLANSPFFHLRLHPSPLLFFRTLDLHFPNEEASLLPKAA